MSLVGRRRVSLSLENVSQMTATITADDLRPAHAERSVCVSGDGAGHSVEEGGPAAAGLEFVVGFVQSRAATGAVVDPRGWGMLVVFPSEGGFGAFLAEDTELL